jgi:phytanoyl-CoA hydroxylase
MTTTPAAEPAAAAAAAIAPASAPAEAPPDDAPAIEFDSHEVDATPDGLYSYEAIARAVEGGLGALTDEHVDFYREYGYLSVNDVFTPQEVQTALDGLLFLIKGGRPDFRGIQYEAKARKMLDTIPLEKRQDYVRKLIGYVDFEDRLKGMCWHTGLIGMVTRLIGEAPEMFANQALLKPPLIGREKPWHQDHAYFNLPIGTPIVGCWIALDEATTENGCMHVVPGSHREGPVVHFKRRDWQICDDHVQVGKIAAVPLSPGGVLFFDGLTHHGTPPTTSRQRRRALQFHYYPASVAKIAAEERLAVFGSEGKDVTC